METIRGDGLSGWEKWPARKTPSETRKGVQMGEQTVLCRDSAED